MHVAMRLRNLLLSNCERGSYAITIVHYISRWNTQLACQLPMSLVRFSRMVIFEYNLESKDIDGIIGAVRLLADIAPSLVTLSNLDSQDDDLSLCHYNYKLIQAIANDNNQPQISNRVIEHANLLPTLKQFLEYESFCQQEQSHQTNLYKSFQSISAETELVVERARASITSPPIIPYCNEATTTMCTCRGKIHFVPLIQPHTDLLLGDCSYLDTCHKMETCKFVHYTTVYPAPLIQKEKQKVTLPGIWTGEFCLRDGPAPAQWINCDIRRLDLGILGHFSVIMADPAWNIHMNLPYGTCNDTEFIDLNIPLVQKEGIILLWVTGRAMEVGRLCLKTWGYKCIDEIIWVKTNQLQKTICTGRTGHWINHSKEHLLIGLKGSPSWLNRGIDVDVIVSPSRETSRKPDEVYDIVDRLVGKCASKLEIFGRQHNTRPGWLTLGNQLDSTHIVNPQLLARYNSWLAAQEMGNLDSK